MKGLILVALASLILLPACNPISRQAKEDLAKPVNCDTAEQDIAMLKREEASVAERFVVGATSVTPAGAAIGILTLTEDEKLEVAIGVYNSKLKEKIREIQTTCGIE